jgi:hypothetical protein
MEGTVFVNKLSRSELENIVLNVSQFTYFEFTNLLGVTIGIVNTTAEKEIVISIWDKLKRRHKITMLEDLIEALETEGYYATQLQADKVECMVV